MKLVLLILASIVVLFFIYVFVLSLIETIKEMRQPPPVAEVGFNAGQKFGGELGVKLIKKAKST